MEFFKGVISELLVELCTNFSKIIKIQCSKGDFGTGYFDDYKEKFCS